MLLTSIKFKTPQEQANHQAVVRYLKEVEGKTFRQWVIEAERRTVQKLQRQRAQEGGG